MFTRLFGKRAVAAVSGAIALSAMVAGTAQAMIISLDQVVVYKNGVLAFNDPFDDGVAPPNAPNFESGPAASYFEYGNVTESSGRAWLYGETRDAQGNLIGPQGLPVIANSVTSSGQTIFSNDLVRVSGIQLLTNTDSTNFVNGLKTVDDIVTMALFDMQAPSTHSSNFGLSMVDLGPAGAGTKDDILRSNVLRSTFSNNVFVSAWRTDASQNPNVVSEQTNIHAILNSQILFRQSTSANDNFIHAEFAYVNTPNFDLTDQNAVNSLTFQSLGSREAFHGEAFTRVELRVLERVAEINTLQMTTASPTSISQSVSTGSSPFEMTFNYRFDTPTGTLDVILDGTVIGTYLASGTVSSSFTTANILIDLPLLDLADVDLEFRITNPTSAPSTVALDAVFFPGLVNGDFGDDTNGWLITTSNPANVFVTTLINTAPVGVPEPATLALFGLGLAGLGIAARRRRSAVVSRR